MRSFFRSKFGGAFYQRQCKVSLPTNKLGSVLQQFLTNEGSPKPVKGYQNFTWPRGFAVLPSVIFYIAQNPCKIAKRYGGEESFFGGFLTLDVFNLIPALDMTGRWSRNQAAGFITSFANDDTFSPGLNMFLLYATNAHGLPQLPTPIAFSNPQIKTLIGQGLYDERTGMRFAQQYKVHFSNSTMVGVDGWRLVQKFVLFGTTPQDGQITGEPLPIEWLRSPVLVREIFS